jgi:hypothetical protein
VGHSAIDVHIVTLITAHITHAMDAPCPSYLFDFLSKTNHPTSTQQSLPDATVTGVRAPQQFCGSASAEPSSFLLPSTTTSAFTVTASAWPVGIHDAPVQLIQARLGQ